MPLASLQVPGALLLDRELTASTKVIWMVDRLLAAPRGAGAAGLVTHCGLARETVRHGLARLAAAGWYPAAAGGSVADAALTTSTAVLPGVLLTDRRIAASARVLYGILQLTPGYSGHAGACTYAGLGALMGASVNTVKQAVKELEQMGWLRVQQKHRRAPVQFSLLSPWRAETEAEVAHLEQRLKEAEFRGEALMREYLTLIVAADDFMDNAAPGYLVNPLTGELLQFDRLYPPGVAFEFNGPQHYGETRRFSAAKVAKQRARDLIKRGLCAERGVHLVVIHAEDLTLAGLLHKVSGLLPLRDLSGDQPLVAFLEFTSRRYRMEATRGRSRDEG